MAKSTTTNDADVVKAMTYLSDPVGCTEMLKAGTLPKEGAGRPYNVIRILVTHADPTAFTLAEVAPPADAPEAIHSAYLDAKARRAGWRAVYTKVANFLLCQAGQGWPSMGQVDLRTRTSHGNGTVKGTEAAMRAWVTMYRARGDEQKAIAQEAKVAAFLAQQAEAV